MLGLTDEEVRSQFPEVFQRLFERVKPDRDKNSRASVRDRWWIFAEPRKVMRRVHANLSRYIATIQTAKHRFFVFLDTEILPDDKLIAIGVEDASLLGVLSSSVHVTWSLATGARLGIGNDPVYNKSTCFDCFPFPLANEVQASRIAELSEKLDAHRKRQQAAYPDLTLTGIYNVLEKLRSGEVLTAKERVIHEHGIVSVLRQLHDDIDAAVLEAYGWSDLLPLLRVRHGSDAPASSQNRDEAGREFDEAILERLVALNAERAAEEARGLIRWLRPEFQDPESVSTPEQSELDADTESEPTSPAITPFKPIKWPSDTIDQVRAVADALQGSPVPLSVDEVAARFTARGPWKKRLPKLLEMLVTLGRAQESSGNYSAIGK